jgi:pyruvate,orthophosphate dikinase
MQQVYFFGNDKADGSANDINLLGGKGANLSEMTNIGIPVPPGFTMFNGPSEKYPCKSGENYGSEIWEY